MTNWQSEEMISIIHHYIRYEQTIISIVVQMGIDKIELEGKICIISIMIILSVIKIMFAKSHNLQ